MANSLCGHAAGINGNFLYKPEYAACAAVAISRFISFSGFQRRRCYICSVQKAGKCGFKVTIFVFIIGTRVFLRCRAFT
eukprot:jgi/Botrbrau1/2604/Bobra.145_1s0029.1